MSELIVVGFDDPIGADRTLIELGKLRRDYLIDLNDAVVAIRDPDGEIHIKQLIDPIGRWASGGGLTGALWGFLVGCLFLNPLAGVAVGGVIGTGAGALSGSLVDYGIDDGFIRELGRTLRPESSALLVLIRKGHLEKVLAHLSVSGGHVLRSSLSPEQEAKLQAALTREQAVIVP